MRYMYMHELLFDQKRTYWSTQAELLRWLKEHGLTPARLEVLRLIEMGYATQAALRQALGIARSTMSRMLTAMEKRGQLVRTASAPQRARKHLSVPRRVRALARALLERGYSKLCARMRAIVDCGRRSEAVHARRVWTVMEHLIRARSELRDRSTRAHGDLPPRPSPPRRRERRDRRAWRLRKREERLEARRRRVAEQEAAEAARLARLGPWASGALLAPSEPFDAAWLERELGG